MEALFIGQTYIDVTFLTDRIPSGDEKIVAEDYAISFGGNAVSAAFCCAKLGVVPELMTSLADDWLARMFLDMAAKYGLSVHGRKVKESSLSFVMPNHGMRAIIRCRDDHYLHPVPPLDLAGCRALHLDGHQADAAIQYAKLCREHGILTSLDGGGMRSNTLELLEHIDVAICSERLCEQLRLSPQALCALLRDKGCRIGGVTLGAKGLIWYDERGNVRHMPALAVPSNAAEPVSNAPAAVNAGEEQPASVEKLTPDAQFNVAVARFHQAVGAKDAAGLKLRVRLEFQQIAQGSGPRAKDAAAYVSSAIPIALRGMTPWPAIGCGVGVPDSKTDVRSGVFAACGVLDPPKVQWVHFSWPEFPLQARQVGLDNGLAMLSVTVDQRGAIVEAHSRVRPDSYGFSESAMQAARKWKTTVPREAGEPVRTQFSVDVPFSQ